MIAESCRRHAASSQWIKASWLVLFLLSLSLSIAVFRLLRLSSSIIICSIRFLILLRNHFKQSLYEATKLWKFQSEFFFGLSFVLIFISGHEFCFISWSYCQANSNVILITKRIHTDLIYVLAWRKKRNIKLFVSEILKAIQRDNSERVNTKKS